MPPKPSGHVPIAPVTSRQAGILRSPGQSYRPIDVPARVRTGHACDRCRDLRAKCSGGVRCVKCTKDDTPCRYSDRKRERNKKNLVYNAAQIADLRSDKSQLVAALRAVVDDPTFQPARHQDLLDMLEKMSEPPNETFEGQSQVPSQPPGYRSTGRSTTETSSIEIDGPAPGLSSRGESLIRSDIGSPDRQRELTSAVDLDFGNGMPGYVGKMSNVTWLQRVKSYLAGTFPRSSIDVGLSELDEYSLQTVSLSWWADDENILAVDEDYVDSHQIPEFQVALVLTEAFFMCLQGAIRFVERQQILHHLQAMYQSQPRTTIPNWEQRKSLALLNIMWAVASRWLQQTGLNQRQVPGHAPCPAFESHLVYYARARSLGLDHRMQVDHPNLETIQAMSVLGFYLIANGSIHRAWGTIAQAIRHSTALGLHLKVTPGAFSQAQLKRRATVWWSLYRMEVSLSEMTGRPKCLHEAEITIPFRPSATEEDAQRNEDQVSSIWTDFLGSAVETANGFKGGQVAWADLNPIFLRNSEVHFAAGLELSELSDRIGSTLYLSPADLTWADVQSTVRRFERDLTRWKDGLAYSLRMGSIHEPTGDFRSSLELHLYFCSLQMILYRPFLSEIRIEDESAESSEFNRRVARECVLAAIQLTKHLPDNPVVREVALVLPWWKLLHYIAQVASVLLLEMCLNLQHVQDESDEVISGLWKALNYLWVFAPISKSAYRAWCIFRPVAVQVTKRFRRDVMSGIPMNAPKPSEWSDSDELHLQRSIHVFSR